MVVDSDLRIPEFKVSSGLCTEYIVDSQATKQRSYLFKT